MPEEETVTVVVGTFKEAKFQIAVENTAGELVAYTGYENYDQAQTAWEDLETGVLYKDKNGEPSITEPFYDEDGTPLTSNRVGDVVAAIARDPKYNRYTAYILGQGEEPVEVEVPVPALNKPVHNAIALGANAWAAGHSSVAIGQGAKAGGHVIISSDDKVIKKTVVVGTFKEAKFQIAVENTAGELVAYTGYENYDQAQTAWEDLETGVLYKDKNGEPSITEPFYDEDGTPLTSNRVGDVVAAIARDPKYNRYTAYILGQGEEPVEVVEEITVPAPPPMEDPVNAIAIGTGAIAEGKENVKNMTAIGTGARATAENALAIGTGAAATAENAIAIGAGVKAENANEIVIGNADHKVMVGGHDVGATFTDHDARITTNTGNIATNSAHISTNAGNIATNTDNIVTNSSNINVNARDILNNKAGIAMAIALAHIPAATGGSRGSVGVGGGFFDGKEAIAIGASFRVGDRGQAKLGISHSSGETGGGVGVGFNF